MALFLQRGTAQGQPPTELLPMSTEDLQRHVGQLSPRTMQRIVQTNVEIRQPVPVDLERVPDGCPPGLEYLVSLPTIVLKREIPTTTTATTSAATTSAATTAAGYGSFSLFSHRNELLYYAREESHGCACTSWCAQHVCGMDIRLTDATGRDVILLHRAAGWPSPCLPCLPLIPINFCWGQETTVIDIVSGKVLGFVLQRFSPFSLSYRLHGVSGKRAVGEEILRVSGSPGRAILGCWPWTSPHLVFTRRAPQEPPPQQPQPQDTQLQPQPQLQPEDSQTQLQPQPQPQPQMQPQPQPQPTRERVHAGTIQASLPLPSDSLFLDFPDETPVVDKMLMIACMVMVDLAFRSRTPSERLDGISPSQSEVSIV